MSSVKAAIVAVLVYFRDYPGAVSLFAGEAAVVAASVGVNLTATQMAQGMAVALPVLLGYFHVAKKASVKAQARADALASGVPAE